MHTDIPIREVQLSAGRYTMRVDRIDEAVKSFPTRGGTKIRHDIYFVDDETEEWYRGEYIIPDSKQTTFKIGERCCFRVTNAGMHEIIKCFSQEIHPANNSQFDDDGEFGPNVGGKSYTFALGFAKDLAIARVRCGQQTGEEISFMNQILKEAWEMHQWLLDPKEPQPF